MPPSNKRAATTCRSIGAVPDSVTKLSSKYRRLGQILRSNVRLVVLLPRLGLSAERNAVLRGATDEELVQIGTWLLMRGARFFLVPSNENC